MMNLALLVGIDYSSEASRSECAAGAMLIRDCLERNGDSSRNFHCKELLSSNAPITREELRNDLKWLFEQNCDTAFFYFAGNGYLRDLDGVLVTQDISQYDEGITMAEVLALVNKSKCERIVIVLDCCHSDVFGHVPDLPTGHTALRSQVVVFGTQSSARLGGCGNLTYLLADALGGGAASLTGEVTVVSAYEFVYRNLGPWDPHPYFRTTLHSFVVLRRCNPLVPKRADPSAPSVFLSYSTQDAEFANKLFDALENRNIEVWYGPHSMSGGEWILDQVNSAIQSHDRVLLVLSDNSIY